ncbi:MAG: hypothetical protein MK135_06735 [Polyangiaceae bacterium]|nr:hypothetical protein [Polyangiaceae bacterium]
MKSILGIFALLFLLTGCQGQKAPSQKIEEVVERDFHLPLADYLPPLGLRFALALRPAQMIQDPGWSSTLGMLLSDERLHHYLQVTGINLRQLNEAWYAEYELGSVLLLGSPATSVAITQDFRERALSLREEPTSEGPLRVMSAIFPEGPAMLISMTGEWLALVRQDLSLGRLLVARAQGRLQEIPPGLAAPAFAPLTPPENAPVQLYVRGPVESAPGAILSELGAANLSLDLLGPACSIEVHLLGTWPSKDLPTTMNRWFEKMQQGRLFAALGLNDPLRGPATECVPRGDYQECRMTIEWRVKDLEERMIPLLQGEFPQISPKEAEPISDQRLPSLPEKI